MESLWSRCSWTTTLQPAKVPRSLVRSSQLHQRWRCSASFKVRESGFVRQVEIDLTVPQTARSVGSALASQSFLTRAFADSFPMAIEYDYALPLLLGNRWRFMNNVGNHF